MQAPVNNVPFLSPNLSTSGFFTESASSSRPTTRDGSVAPPTPVNGTSSSNPFSSNKERKSSFSRKASLSRSGRRGSASTTTSSNAVITDAAAPPALPDYALAAAAKVVPRDPLRSPISPEGLSTTLSRTTASTYMPTTPSAMGPSPTMWQPNEASSIHQQIIDIAHKRMSTLDYLRRAHEGRVYWFNTYFLDKNDLARMPAYDPRKLARKATNLLLLGLSIPTINDLYSSTPFEFLRCLNALFSEFDAFQQLHSDSANTLSRARLPNMFRRPGGKSRRSTSVADGMYDEGGGGLPAGGAGASAPSVMNFAISESDLLPGEEYTYLLTPSLPFDPDFFETFATLCDVLIDCYKRFLMLVATPRECSSPVAELFAKVDSKVKKILVQGVVKEFEEQSKAHVKSEIASIGKVVLSGLM